MPEMNLHDLGKTIIREGKALGATEVATVIHKIKRLQVRFSRNKIDVSSYWEYYTADIFVAIDKRVGVSSTESTRIEDFLRSVNNAVASAKLSEERKDFEGLYPGGGSYSAYKPLSEDILDEERLIDASTAAINSALSNGAKKVAGVIYATYVERAVFTSNDIEVINTPGRTSVEVSVRAFYDSELSGHGISVGIDWSHVDPETAGKEASEIALRSTKKVKIDPGKYDVLFYPMAIANLIDYLSMLLSGLYIYMKISPYAGRIGETVSSEEFTLIDNPLREDSVGFLVVDDEGFPTRKKPIIEKGVLKTYLLNYWLSRYFGLENTGNAGIIFPQAFTLEVSPGSESVESLEEDLKEGIIITNTWYTRFQNYFTGDFSTVPRDNAFYVKNGDIIGVVRNIRISDNLPLMFSRIAALGNDVKQVKWWEVGTPTYTPSILIKDVQLSIH
ncbi:MAG: TldD/PmbA family protein [Euryarchaeota archaeon]|nr:TldD/PmbA family protein [Euryarchaeota archaeon]